MKITQNKEKIALVAKLLKEEKITFEEGLKLLEETVEKGPLQSLPGIGIPNIKPNPIGQPWTGPTPYPFNPLYPSVITY